MLRTLNKVSRMRLWASFLKIILLWVFCHASTMHASADDLPYPPTYFSIFRVNLSVAKDVAKNCKTIGIDKKKYHELIEAQFEKLERDGFSRKNWRSEMKDVPKGLRDRPILEFYMKWGVESGNSDSYCIAGRSEIKANSMIGTLLKQAP